MAEATVGGDSEQLLKEDDVKQVQFATGRRGGYKEEDVDNFLERVETTLHRLYWDLAGAQQEAEELRERVQTLEAQGAGSAQAPAAVADDGEKDRRLEAAEREVETLRGRTAALQEQLRDALAAPAPEPTVVDPGQAAAKVLQLAQRTADELLEQSRSESAAQLTAAERTARQTLADAEFTARDTLARATSEAEALATASRAEHQELLVKVAEVRRAEAAARAAAISALEDGLAHLARSAKHGLPDAPAAVAADGEPGWPQVA